MMEKVTVSTDALRQVLQALNGSGHLIRELQVLRGPAFSDSPIEILIGEFNAAIDAHNKERSHHDTDTG